MIERKFGKRREREERKTDKKRGTTRDERVSKSLFSVFDINVITKVLSKRKMREREREKEQLTKKYE